MSRYGNIGLTAATILSASLVTPNDAAAESVQEKVLYSFCSQPACADGGGPQAGLIADSIGNLYGVTGGGAGAAFKLNRHGVETVLHSFCSYPDCRDGQYPYPGVFANGTVRFYGTTNAGGANGHGTIFRLSRQSRVRRLYSFCSQPNCADGAYPWAGLINDDQGNLYGTTNAGGAHDWGVVFKLAPDGTETVLYSFCALTSCADGAQPYAGLIADNKGNLYGTTHWGGAHIAGTVFRLAPDGSETVLYSFCSQSNCADGSAPYASLARDAQGNLYGTTLEGGAKKSAGTVYKISTDGSETVLHAFCSQPNCVDGRFPYAGLLADSAGNLYGTTAYGGTSDQGIVFRVAPDGTETVLYSFCSQPNCTDGARPFAPLNRDTEGNLYGTTQGGGANNEGTVFKITIQQ